MDLDSRRGEFVFCGDSPNDEPMFAFFPLSFAMANIREFLEIIERRPAFVASREAGAGFAEVADLILKARAGGRAAP